MESMNLFRTDRHNIYTVALNKTTLSAYDDKRFILDDGTHTLANAHWRTKSWLEEVASSRLYLHFGRLGINMFSVTCDGRCTKRTPVKQM